MSDTRNDTPDPAKMFAGNKVHPLFTGIIKQHFPAVGSDAEYLRGLAERLMHVPLAHGTDQSDVDRLTEIAASFRPTVDPDLLVTERGLAETIAVMTLNGECPACLQMAEVANPDCDDHHAFEMTAEDNQDTMTSLINKAREIIDTPRPFTPPIVWTKPLTPCGPKDQPHVKLLGTVYILGVMFHAEAYEVEDKPDRVLQLGEGPHFTDTIQQTGKQDESETYLAEILNIVQGSANTVTIDGRDYVLAITPSQR